MRVYNHDDAFEYEERMKEYAEEDEGNRESEDFRHATSGEGYDRTNLDLTGVQEDLIKAAHQLGKPVVVVMISGRPQTIPWVKQNIPAIVEAWYPGEQGGSAIADVLFGRVNPSGRLPVYISRECRPAPSELQSQAFGKGLLSQAREP